MNRQVEWTERALEDLDDIVTYIAQDNETAAWDFHDYIQQAAHHLGVSPIGRPGEVPGTIERVLPRYPSYIIIYEKNDWMITIMRIFHTAQKHKVKPITIT